MWDIIEYAVILVALVGFMEILFHNPIRTTEEWDQDDEESNEDEK